MLRPKISHHLEYPGNTDVVNECKCRICEFDSQTTEYESDVQQLQQHYKFKHPVEDLPAVPGQSFRSLHQAVEFQSVVGEMHFYSTC